MASTAKVGKPGVHVITVGGGAGEAATRITKVNGDGTVDDEQGRGVPFVAEGELPPAGATHYFQAVDYTS
jgi:hypothetical protein